MHLYMVSTIGDYSFGAQLRAHEWNSGYPSNLFPLLRKRTLVESKS